MAISTYANLQTAVLSWLTRSGDTALSAYVPDFIVLCEAEINRVLRVREMEASADLTVSAQSVTLPTGYMQMRRLFLYISPYTPLEYVTPDRFWTGYAVSTGQPTVYTIEGDNILFGPTPDTTYTGKCLYWQRQDITTSAHLLFTRNPDLYLFGSLVKAEPFIRNDERLPLWKSQYAEAVDQIAQASNKDRHSGSPLRSRPDTLGM